MKRPSVYVSLVAKHRATELAIWGQIHLGKGKFEEIANQGWEGGHRWEVAPVACQNWVDNAVISSR